MNFVIEMLTRQHNRSTFTCGSDALDSYIRKQASQDIRRRVARVFVALPERENIVAGFYTLSAGSVERSSLPPETAKRLPLYPVPVARIGRLAVDLRWSGQQLGTTLLADAFQRIIRASGTLAVHAVIVDAKDERAQRFYERFGFRLLPDTGRCLFYPLAQAEKNHA